MFLLCQSFKTINYLYMKYVLILFFTCISSVLLAQGEDLTGVWEGTLQQGNKLFQFALKLSKESNRKYSGITYIKREEREASMDMIAKFRGGKLFFEETKLNTKKNASQKLCIKTGRLTYSIEQGIFCLTGTWKTKNCSQGTIFLQKRGHVSCSNYTTRYTKNMIRNGDFEQNHQSFKSEYNPAITLGNGSYMIVDNAKLMNHQYFTGRGNCNFMAVDGATKPNVIVWEQSINVKAHTTYLFAVKTTTTNIEAINPAVLDFYMDNIIIGPSFSCPHKLNKWNQYTYKWVASETREVSFKIICKTTSLEGNDFGLDNISVYELESNPPTSFQKKLKRAKQGTSIVLKSVLFESGTANLLEESYHELDMLLSFLVAHPMVEIRIDGHTDNIGKESDNLYLSKQRADAIQQYLTHKGIRMERLTTKGFGERMSLVSNETIEGRQKNRRVEFTIIKMK